MKMSMAGKERRSLTLLQLTAGAMLAAISAALGFPLIMALGAYGDFSEKLAGFKLLFMYSVIVTAAHTLILGIPAIIGLNLLEALSFRNLAIAGIMIGSIPMSFLSLQWTPIGGLSGFIGATAFWAIFKVLASEHCVQPPAAR